MADKSVDLFDSNFKSTHLTSKQTSHQVRSLKPFDKNVELRVIVVSKKDNFTTKSQVSFTSFIVADSTGSIIANFYSSSGSSHSYSGDAINNGDILYINGAYTSLFKGQLILYEGKAGVVFKIGEYFFNFSEEPNISMLDWSDYARGAETGAIGGVQGTAQP